MATLTLAIYPQMLLIAFAALIPKSNACLPGADAFWVVRENEYTAQAAQHLGVAVEVIAQKNSAMQPDLVLPGETYVVPYTSCLQPPATWSVTEVASGETSSCMAFLGLSEHTTVTHGASEHGTPIIPTHVVSTITNTNQKPHLSSKPAGNIQSDDDTTSQTTETEKTHQSPVPTIAPPKTTSTAPALTEVPEMEDPTTLMVTLSPTPLVTTVEVTKTVPFTEEEPQIIFNNGERYCYNGQEALSGTDEAAYIATSKAFCELSRNPLNNADNRSFVRVMETESKSYPYALFSLFWNNLDSACSQSGASEADTGICSNIMLDNFKQCKFVKVPCQTHLPLNAAP